MSEHRPNLEAIMKNQRTRNPTRSDQTRNRRPFWRWVQMQNFTNEQPEDGCSLCGIRLHQNGSDSIQCMAYLCNTVGPKNRKCPFSLSLSLFLSAPLALSTGTVCLLDCLLVFGKPQPLRKQTVVLPNSPPTTQTTTTTTTTTETTTIRQGYQIQN